jgi:hypothetical protein
MKKFFMFCLYNGRFWHPQPTAKAAGQAAPGEATLWCGPALLGWPGLLDQITPPPATGCGQPTQGEKPNEERRR